MGISKGLVIGAAIVVCIAGGVFATQQAANSKVKKELDLSIADVAEYVSIEYDDVSTSLLSKSVSIKNLKIAEKDSSKTLQISELSVSNWKVGSKAQTDLCVDMNGIDIPLAELYAEAPEMKKLGYGDIVNGNVSWCYKYDLKGGTLALNGLEMSIDKVGAVSFSIVLSNLDLGIDITGKTDDEVLEEAVKQFEVNPMMALGMLTKIALTSAEIKYIDAGVVPKWLDMIEANEQVTRKEMRAKLSRELEQNMGGTEKRTVQARKSLMNFFDNPNVIRVIIAPKKPVSIMSLQALRTPDDIMDRLDLRVLN